MKTSQAGNGKVFLNVCTEEAVPRPPPFSDDALRRLTQAEDVKDSKLMDYYLPMILSEVRQETDKCEGNTFVQQGVTNLCSWEAMPGKYQPILLNDSLITNDVRR